MTSATYFSGVARQANVANYLTAARAVASVPVVMFLFLGLQWWSFVLVLAAGLTDWLDGHLARRWQLLTPLGRVADPLADKLFTTFTLLPMMFVHESLYLAVLWTSVIGYDAYTTWRRRREIGRAILNYDGDQADLPVSYISKAKTAFLFVLVAYCYVPAPFGSQALLNTLTVIALGLVAYSWYTHLVARAK